MWFHVIKGINSIFWAIVGLFGNIMIIGTITTTKSLRTTGNMLLLNLALTDIWVSGLSGPMALVGIIVGKKLFHNYFAVCDVLATICITTCMCSIITIAMISINRYFYICQKNWYNILFNKKTMFFWCLACWFIGLISDLPNQFFMNYARHGFDPKYDLCLWDRNFNPTSGQMYGILALCAVVFAFIWYFKLFLFVRKKRTTINVQANGRTDKRQMQNLSLAKTLFIIYAVYILCWAPIALTMVIDTGNTLSNDWYGFSLQIAHTNSSLNFIIYGLTNKQMRKGYKLFLLKYVPFAGKVLNRQDSTSAVSSKTRTRQTTRIRNTQMSGVARAKNTQMTSHM